MKKKLDELNRKIRHSRKKPDGMIHKRNVLRKAIEDLKGPIMGAASEDSEEPQWDFRELNRAF